MKDFLKHFPYFRLLAMSILAGLLLNACSSSRTVRSYQTETFNTEKTPYQYYSSRQPEEACEIAKRALLSQGYQVNDAKPRNISGEKYFRPSEETASTLSISLVCLPSSLGAVIFAVGHETQYEMKAKGASAGVSVAAVGSVSLPWAIDKDTLVKIGEETITAPGFYQRLFDLIKSLDD